ncbi:hypothetical protein Q31b_15160 [Novipirellula aureliae]|uniref:Arrestin-like N-terminal domain-containing protein n=1 Tax=Novipirellula aureliae TaxID=2527966 RepID=A0A5C6E4W7_9BACT|nr:sporulation protein [Novipirellula aureliae]TWU43982.1 hypothetical protein Q31b_15160 [Novipirellula aureliae]
MAKCDLSINLDDKADVLHDGGSTIRGTVRVDVDNDVKCNGLIVESAWRTHGRGNIAKGSTDKVTLFTGHWTAGQHVEYPFELKIADWPPTYHGHYLNIDHYIDARVDIPWSFDPKASVPFLVRAACDNTQAVVPRTTKQINGIAGGCIAALVIAGFAMFVAAFVIGDGGIIPIIFLGAFGLIGASVFLVKSVLPKWVLGQVACDLGMTTVSPGQTIKGQLSFSPRKNLQINGITMKVSANEQCISGSGSNKKTHHHRLFQSTETLEGATTLSANRPLHYDFSYQIPNDAPFSVELRDNKLHWIVEVSIDIPRWPDWRKKIKLQVLPDESASDRVRSQTEPTTEISAAAESETITFAETARHLWAVRDHPVKRSALIDAIVGLSFDMSAHIERRLLYGGRDAPNVYRDGHAVWAHSDDPELPLVLYIPKDLGDEFEQLGRGLWHGRATVIGWDDRNERLQLKVEVLKPSDGR